MRFFVIDTGGKVIAASQAGKYKTLCQCIGLAMLMLPMWSLAPEGVNDTPMWMTVYYTITYAADLSCADSLPVFRWRVSGQYVRRP